MGGEGSGRKPDLAKNFVSQANKVATQPVPHGVSEDSFFIPNYSGVAHHEPTLAELDSRYLTSINWGDITGTLSNQTDLNNQLTSISGAYATHAADSSDPHGATLTQTNLVVTEVKSALIPDGDNTRDLGDSSHHWDDVYIDTLYVDGGASIYGAGSSVEIAGALPRHIADQTTSGAKYIPNVVYNTTSGGITASDFPIGTLLIIYS